MDAATATILAATIGATAGILGGVVTNLLHLYKAEAEWKRARKDQLENNLRSGVQELVQHVGTALHSMCWLTWLAKERPDRLNQDRIDGYDAELHAIAAKINGALGSIAAIDHQAFVILKEEIDSVFTLDWKIGTAALRFDMDPRSTAAALAGFYETVSLMHDELPGKFGGAVSRRVTEIRDQASTQKLR